MRYLNDLNVALDEPVVLALSDFLSCPTLGEFTRENFITGWSDASKESSKPLDTLAKQAAYLTTLRKQLKTDPVYFKKIYRASFQFAKPEGQRSVPSDAAVEFWRMFFQASTGGIDWKSPTSPKTPWLDLWIEFYNSQHKRPVNKDLWNMVGELMLKTIERDGEKLEWYKEDGAWPMAIDEFIAWAKEQREEIGAAAATAEGTVGGTDGANDVEMT
jgi:DCN1-like protein 1/2